MRRKLVLTAALVLGALSAGVAAADPPPSFPGQGVVNADNPRDGGHCHIVNPATNAPFTIVNPSPHEGGHAHGAPFSATAC